MVSSTAVAVELVVVYQKILAIPSQALTFHVKLYTNLSTLRNLCAARVKPRPTLRILKDGSS